MTRDDVSGDAVRALPGSSCVCASEELSDVEEVGRDGWCSTPRPGHCQIDHASAPAGNNLHEAGWGVMDGGGQEPGYAVRALPGSDQWETVSKIPAAGRGII